MSDNSQNLLDETPEVEAEAPEQQSVHKWEYRPRQNPVWGTVEKRGLVVGRAGKQKVIPPDEVYYLATLGCTTRDIAVWFGVPEETLKYNFKEYIDKAKEDIKQRLRQAQIKAALAGNVAMLIFLGKNMLGQSDNPTNTDDDKILPWTDEK